MARQRLVRCPAHSPLVTDWIADGASCAALLVAGLSFLDARRRAGRQEAVEAKVARIEEERRAEELRPRLVVEEVPDGRFDDLGFTIRVRSECDRPLHIGEVTIVEDAAAPSALAALVSRRVSGLVQHEDIDTARSRLTDPSCWNSSAGTRYSAPTAPVASRCRLMSLAPPGPG